MLMDLSVNTLKCIWVHDFLGFLSKWPHLYRNSSSILVQVTCRSASSLPFPCRQIKAPICFKHLSKNGYDEVKLSSTTSLLHQNRLRWPFCLSVNSWLFILSSDFSPGSWVQPYKNNRKDSRYSQDYFLMSIFTSKHLLKLASPCLLQLPFPALM